jgi:general secretion pathway protein M
MILVPGSWQSRGLALALLLSLLGMAYLLLAHPVITKFTFYAEKQTEYRDRLLRYKRIAATRPLIEQRLATLQQRQRTTADFLKSSTHTLAAAELQEQVKSIIVSHGGRLVSTQILAARNGELFPRVTIKVRMKGDIEGVLQVFHALEAGRPFLFLDNVYMRVRVIKRRRTVRPRRGQRVQQEGELDVRFELSGFMRSVGQ